MIEVRLFATFREGRQKIIHFDSTYSNISDILKELNIPKSEVAICLINGFHSKLDVKIKEKDVISLFPPVGGG